jgi:galactokinase
VAALMAFQALGGWELDGAKAALLCQRAENEFLGVRVGIMDQFISRLGRKDHALFIDCRTLEYEPIPLHAEGHVFMVADSRKSRELAASEYNVRRAQCEQAVAALRDGLPAIKALRDVTPDAFLQQSWRLDTLTGRRARHVVFEDDRVLRAIAALRESKLADFGALMNDSHESLRFDYEVSSRELDVLVGAARQVDGCAGARLTGAGFGGCAVVFCRRADLAKVRDGIAERFYSGCADHILQAEAGCGAVHS